MQFSGSIPSSLLVLFSPISCLGQMLQERGDQEWARCCAVLGQEGSQKICRGWRESGLGERVRAGPPGWHPGVHQVVSSPGAQTPREGIASQAILQDCGLSLEGQTAVCPCFWPAHGESSEHSRDQGRDPGPDNSVGLSWERPPPAVKVGHPWAKPTAI